MNRRHFFKILAGLFGSTLLAKFLPESFWSAWSVSPRGLENPVFLGKEVVMNGFRIYDRHLGLLAEKMYEEAHRPPFLPMLEGMGVIIIEPSKTK